MTSRSRSAWVLGLGIVALVGARGSDALAEAAGEGQLSVVSMPYARVSVDGRDVGTTPVLRRGIAVGTHVLVLRSADGATRTMRVEVRAGEHTRITVRLTDPPPPLAPGAPPPPTVADDESPPRTTDGVLLVNTTPWSHVILDGRTIGPTPQRVRVRAGRHRLVLRTAAGHSETVVVVVRAGESLRVVRRLQPARLRSP